MAWLIDSLTEIKTRVTFVMFETYCTIKHEIKFRMIFQDNL